MLYPVKHIRITTPAGRDVPVWYLHSEADYLDDPDGAERRVAGIAPGKERACADQAEQAREKGAVPKAATLEAQGSKWKAIADRTWPVVWASLARALPIVNGYAVTPSRRQARVVAPRTVMCTAYPDAIELIYSKAAGAKTFGVSRRDEIASALARQSFPPLSSPCKVAVADDWLGRGETFDAMMDRIENDFSGTTFDFIGAFPGVSQTFVKPSNAMQDALADIMNDMGGGAGIDLHGAPDDSK